MAVEHANPDEIGDGREVKPVHFFFPTITPEEGRTLDNETVIISERRTKAMRMYRERRTMREIAAELKVSLNTICRDINAVMEGYKLIAAQDAKDHIAELLSQLSHREHQIEQAWAKSLGELVETSDTKRKTAAGDHNVSVVKQKEKTGNPMYTAQLLECLKMRARLLGLLSKNDLAAEGRAVELQRSGENVLAGMSDSEVDDAIRKILDGIRPEAASGTGEGEATPGT